MTDAAIVDRNSKIRTTTLVGIAVNIFLAVFKILAGIYANSQTVVADGIHSFSDLFTDFGMLLGSKLWSKPKDDEHPYGHGRIEQVVTFFIGIILAITSVFICYNAITGIEENDFVKPQIPALIAALLSVVIKEKLYRWSANIARKINSSALMANAWHHRSDAISSIPAAITVAFATLYSQWHFIDHVGAIIVSLIIFHASLKIIFPSINQLVDMAPPKELRESILHMIKDIKEVREAHALRTRYVGPDIAVDIHVLVDPGITVRSGHDIAEKTEALVKEKFPSITDVMVHIEPFEYK